MTPALTFFRRARPAHPVRLVFRDRSRTAETRSRHGAYGSLLVAFSIVTIWPPEKKIALGLDIQGGTSFLIRLVGGDKEVNKAMLDQAVEVIRKRVDYFGGGEPVITPGRERSDSCSDSRARYGEDSGSARATLTGGEARVSPGLSGQRRTA